MKIKESKDQFAKDCDLLCVMDPTCKEFSIEAKLLVPLKENADPKGTCRTYRKGCKFEDNIDSNVFEKSPSVYPVDTPNSCTHLPKYNSNSKEVAKCKSLTTMNTCKGNVECSWNVPLCGFEKLVIKNKNHKVLNLQRVKSPLVESFDMNEIWSVDTTGLGFPPDDCPIKEYKVCEDVKCSSTLAESWYKFLKNKMSIDFSKAIKAKTVYLGAITSGDVKSFLPLKINVCGDEKVSTVSPLVKNLKYDVGESVKTFNVSKLFLNNDQTNCPITNYQILASENGAKLSLENSKIATLNDIKLSVNFETKADFVFFVEAKTASGSTAAQKFYVKITKKVDETTAAAEAASTAGKTDFEIFLEKATKIDP